MLDFFHKNKYLKELRKNLSFEEGAVIELHYREILRNGTRQELSEYANELLLQYPEQADTILKVTRYLIRNFKACQVPFQDEDAHNGATEPHVSHALSARLSSRPSGWSQRTLDSFVPLLETKSFIISNASKQKVIENTKRLAMVQKRKQFVKNSLGLEDPDIAAPNPCEYSYSLTAACLNRFFGA